jgi:hypothetical protein
VLTTNGTYPWSFVTQIFHNVQPCHGGERKRFEIITPTSPRGIIDGFNLAKRNL